MSEIIAHIVIDDNVKPQAKSCVNGLSSRASGMFESPLSADGLEPVTHWISSGWVDSGLVVALSSPAMLKYVCDAKSYPMTIDEATTLLASTQYSTDGNEDAQAFIARIGLKQVLA